MTRRGMTLVEVVVAMSLMAVLAGLVLALFRSANTFLKIGSEQSQKNRLSAIIYAKLEYDFFHMGSRGRIVSSDSASCLQRSALDIDGRFQTDSQGYPSWQQWVEYAIDDQQLVRRAANISEPNLPFSRTGVPLKTTEVLTQDVRSGSWTPLGEQSLVLRLTVGPESAAETFQFLFTAGQGDAL